MLVVFEGIDGSGKTTVSTRVAKKLRAEGLTVEHVREEGTFSSAVTQGIREFTRDSRNLELTPEAEVLLYSAREMQLFTEVTKPALESADLVIADRFFYTPELLATHGRGLDPEWVRQVVHAASRGAVADLVILVDADPHLARARRRVAKIERPDDKPSSRKGLAGAGLQHRLAAGYRERAAAEPERWIVVDNGEASLDELIGRVTQVIRTALKSGTKAAIAEAKSAAPARRAAPAIAGPEDARAAFLEWIDRRAASEPGVAAFFLSGLAGEPFDSRRRQLAAKAPAVIAGGLAGMTDAVSWELRKELLAKVPEAVIRSLDENASPEADQMRAANAAKVPGAVASSLRRRGDDAAWKMRIELYPKAPDEVMASLAYDDSLKAWGIRDRWLSERRERLSTDPRAAEVLAKSIAGCESQRGWAAREDCFAMAPVEAIASLRALTGEDAWIWRERWISRAPKTVMGTLAEMDHPKAWVLRQACVLRCKEALDSVMRLDGEEAWSLRETGVGSWPSTAVKSMGPALAETGRGRALLARALQAAPSNVSLWKHAAALSAAQGDTQSKIRA